jgi:hypothetical protein
MVTMLHLLLLETKTQPSLPLPHSKTQEDIEDTTTSSGSKVVEALGDATPHLGSVNYPTRELPLVPTSIRAEVGTSDLDV